MVYKRKCLSYSPVQGMYRVRFPSRSPIRAPLSQLEEEAGLNSVQSRFES